MTTTHDDNATTWRDLVDQLTPDQIPQPITNPNAVLRKRHSRRNLSLESVATTV